MAAKRSAAQKSPRDGAIQDGDPQGECVSARVPLPELGWVAGAGRPLEIALAPLRDKLLHTVKSAFEEVRSGGEPQQRELMEMAENAAERLLALINDILDFSRIESRRLELTEEAFSLHGCVEAADRLFDIQAAEKTIDLSWSLHSQVPGLVIGDPNRLGQIRDLLSMALYQCGWQVLTAGNGSEAVKLWESRLFALILMDIQMPVMKGLDATRTIRAREREGASHTPIIALTAHARPEDEQMCLHAGMKGYFRKPLNLERLCTMVKDFAGG